MNHRTDRPAVLRDSWRPDENHQPMVRKARKVSLLVLLSALLLAAFAAFFFLLTEPILHPNTYVVLAGGDSVESDSIPPVHFAGKDFSRFDSLAPFLATDAIDSLEQQVQLVPNQELNQLQERIQTLESESRDVLILYLSAHGLIINGKASLIVDGFDPSSPGVGSFTVRSLLQLLSESQFKTKLLILDAGQIPLDPWLGNVANQFPARLRETVTSFNQSNVWVLSSNDLAQHSYVSEPAKASIFAHFVRESLSGDGDLNDDGFLHLDEFAEAVRQRVESFSRLQTDAPLQRPVLWGSQGSESNPVLLSVETQSVIEQLPDESEGQQDEIAEDASGGAPDSGESVASQDPQNSKVESDPPTQENETPVADGDTDSQKGDSNSNGVEQAGIASSTTSENEASDPLGRPVLPKTTLGLQEQHSSQHKQALDAVWRRTYGSHGPLVRSVWEVYFSLERSQTYPRRPLDYAPVEWRRLGETIAFHDYRIRRDLDANPSADRLREILVALKAIEQGKALPTTGKLDEAIKIAERRETPQVPVNASLSITHLKVLNQNGFCELPAATLKLIQKFENVNQLSNGEKLKELLDSQPLLLQWYEPQLARRVVQLENLNWTEQRQVIHLSMMGGNSTDPISLAFRDISDKFQRAHQNRRVGTQILLEQTVPNWRGLATSLLTESRRQYWAANRDFLVMQNALAIRNEMVFRLPYYLRMPYADSESFLSELYHRLGRLLDATADLVDNLNRYDQTDVAASVEAATNQVVKCNREFVGFLVSSGKEGTKSATQKSLFNRQAALLAPGLDLPVRNEILLSIYRESLPTSSSVESFTLSADESTESSVPNELLAYQRQFDLVLKYARLARLADADLTGYGELVEKINRCFSVDVREAPNVMTRDRIDEINRMTSGFFRALPGHIDSRLLELQDLSDEAKRNQQLHRLENMLSLRLMIDSRNAPLNDSVADQAKIIHPARCFSILSGQRNEMRNETVTEVQRIRNSFQKRLEFQRLAANELKGQPKLARAVPLELEIQSAESISLATQKVRVVEFDLGFRGESAKPVWVFAEFDDTKLNVQAVSNNRVINRNQWLESAPDLLDSRQAMSTIDVLNKNDKDAFAPTMILQPGDSEKLRLEVAKKNDAAHTRLYLTIVTEGQISRHETTVLMPAQSDWQLFLESPFSETTRSGSELVVSPLPNQTVDFDVQLRNLSGRPRKISFELLAAGSQVKLLPPSGEVDPQQLVEYFDSVGNPSSLQGRGDIVIPATTGLQSIPLQSEPEKQKAKAPATNQPSNSKDAESILQIRHGLFVVVTDQVSLKSKVWLVRFRPQMPRRYVSAVARYDALRERVIVEVSRPADAPMPSGGHTIRCEFANPLAMGTESFLEGQLTPEKRTLRLYSFVAKSNNRVEKLYLHVDEYPRAFVFNVPCGNVSEGVPESRNEMRIRVTSPKAGKGFLAPVDRIPVTFEVDAPVGAFADSRDLVSLGLDADRDRELSEESTMTWVTDRQATVWVSEMGKTRSLRLVNKVEDFQVELPGANYRNLKVNLLARLQVGRKVVWSNPREIALDAAPPKIVSIQTTPTGAVAQDEKLSVRVVADDGQMSGVKAVKIGFFDQATEKFDEKLPQVDAKKNVDNSWSAELPLSSIPIGNRIGAVLATDQVGNQSVLKTFGIKVISKEVKEKMTETVTVQGTVRYYKSPQPNVPVLLRSSQGKTYTANSADDGTFRITEVPLGPYFLKAKSVIRNKPRIAELKLDLKSGQKSSRLDVELK